MKFIKTILAAVLAVFALNVGAQTLQPQTLSAFSVGETNGGGTLPWVIVSANSINGGTPRVTYIQASSDLVNAKCQAYRVTAQVSCNLTNSTTTLNVPFQQTNGYSSGGIVVIRHRLTDNYERRVLATPPIVAGGTNLLVTVVTDEAVVPGDVVYAVSTTKAPFLYVNNNTIAGTNSFVGAGGVMFGQRGLPLLLEVNATTIGHLTTVSGDYLP